MYSEEPAGCGPIRQGLAVKLTRPHRRRLALLAGACLAAILAADVPAGATEADSAAHHVRSQAERRKAVERRKAAVRRTLRRRVQRHPGTVLRPRFLRRAADVDFDLPVTVRLNPAVTNAPVFAASDDSFQLDLGTGASAAPAPVGVHAGVVATTLSGGFSAFMKFGRDTSGFGRLGVIELGFASAAIDATGVDLVNGDPACGDGPLLRTEPTIDIAAHPGGGSYGYLDMFGQAFHLDLRTRFSFHSQARATCAGALAPTALLNGSTLPPVVLRADGRFMVTPAITADGRLRLGKLALTGTQEQIGGSLHACTAAPPGLDPCDGGPDDATLPVRTQAVSFTAEVIVGTAPT